MGEGRAGKEQKRTLRQVVGSIFKTPRKVQNAKFDRDMDIANQSLKQSNKALGK